jgi:hypothetical protein
MAASKSPNIIIVFNDVQANCTRITRVGKQLGRDRFSNLIAIFFVLFQVNVFIDQGVLPLFFCYIPSGFLQGRGSNGARRRVDSSRP